MPEFSRHLDEDEQQAKDQKPGFDTQVHHHDKRGRLLSTNPYSLHVVDGVRFFERPKHSGNLYWEDGKPAGRMVSGKVHRGAEHVNYSAPLTGSAKMQFELDAEKAKSAKLAAELTQIKKEQAEKEHQQKLAKQQAAAQPKDKNVNGPGNL